MARMSQKELLNDGIGSFLKKGIAGAARVAGGAIGAINTGAQMGINATIGGMAAGGKAGYEKEKTKQKSPESEWRRAVIDAGFYPAKGSDPPVGLKHAKQYPIDIEVHQGKDQVDSKGRVKKVPGKLLKRRLILKWDKDSKSFSSINPFRPGKKNKKKKKVTQQPGPTTGSPPAPGPAPTPGVVTSSTCQKDLLRQLQLLSK